MKKLVVFAASVFFWASVALNAQVGFRQHIWSHRTPITVFNQTDDKKPVRLFVDGKVVEEILRYGDNWGFGAGGGFFPFQPDSYNRQFTISAQVCAETPMTRFVVPPPVWAADTTLLGSLALTWDYLRTNPSEPELRQRVKEIERFFDHRLGKKDMIRPLRNWFNDVKRRGLSFVGPGCVGPRIVGVDVQISGSIYNQQQSAVTLYIRGANGCYWVQRPGYAYASAPCAQ